jgi:hypothetical protein
LNATDPLGLKCKKGHSCPKPKPKPTPKKKSTAVKCEGSGAPTEQQLIGCSDYTITGKPSAPTNSGTTQWSNAAITFGTIFGLAAPGAAAPGEDDPPDVTFGHGARHLAGTGLNQGEVESTIQTQVQQSVSGASSSGSFWGRVTVNGQSIEYRAYTLPDGTINVGTYYGVP